MKSRTLPVVILLTAVCAITIAFMVVESRPEPSAEAIPARNASPAAPVSPAPIDSPLDAPLGREESLPAPFTREEPAYADTTEPVRAPVSAEAAVNAEVVTTSSMLSQVNEEEIEKAFDMLGQLLGLPEVSPEELKRKVEEIGKLRFRRNVPVDFMTRDELSSYIRDLFETEYPPDVAEREERVLRALGFLDSDQDLRSIRARVLNENIAGFYDERPNVRKLFAISSSGRKLNLMNQLILSHELRHALQDQHLDLGRILGEMSDYDDRRLAALSLIEGDATLLMEKYMASGQSESATGLDGLLAGFGAEAMDGRTLAEMFAGPELRSAPAVVREQLIVPYLEGRRLAGEIYQEGGFRSLNERLRRLPQSMEQVLHPEKYLEQVDEPIEVTLSGVSGASIESEGRIGELLVRTLFEASLPKEEGVEAAAGWGGDHYALWADDESRYHLLWRSVWDTDRDAEEFFDALARFTSVHFGEGPTPAGPSDSMSVEARDGSSSRVIRRGREVVLEREGFR